MSPKEIIINSLKSVALGDFGHDLPDEQFEPEADRILANFNSAGLVIVHREPTVEMLVAAQEEWMCVRAAEERGDFIWRAMIDAALSLPSEQRGSE